MKIGSGPSDLRRRLPAVDRLLADERFQRLISLYGRELVREHLRRALDLLRARLADDGGRDGCELERQLEGLAERVDERLRREAGRLRRVLNATGILLHTNLGRAPLPRAVTAELPALLNSYCDLEYDLETGRRGERNRRAERLLKQLTGAEAGLVVNNNAGALVLILAALAASKEVVVSRGELIEIGGSFRIPEILTAAGARLVEVGTTNRTRPADYAAAIGSETALLLKVHPSNYRMTGFVGSVAAEELVELGRRHGRPVVVDEGSGLLRPHPAPQLSDHPSFQELVRAGCDLVCGSGDKLLGGPQAGLIAGRRELVECCRRHPLYRALRPDRMAFAALEAVLRHHLAGRPLPIDRLWPEGAEHRVRLRKAAAGTGAEIVTADAFLGGGAAPERPIPGQVLALPGGDELLQRLREADPPVVGYLREGRLILDLRTVDPADDAALVAAVRAAALE
ncbi:MAG: L-seryl-tRNA(Sec) selenium transferase [Thermoanaerobaculia bacterium]